MIPQSSSDTKNHHHHQHHHQQQQQQETPRTVDPLCILPIPSPAVSLCFVAKDNHQNNINHDLASSSDNNNNNNDDVDTNTTFDNLFETFQFENLGMLVTGGTGGGRKRQKEEAQARQQRQEKEAATQQ